MRHAVLGCAALLGAAGALGQSATALAQTPAPARLSLEITESQTRFIPFYDTRRLATAFATGVLFGAFFWRRLKR